MSNAHLTSSRTGALRTESIGSGSKQLATIKPPPQFQDSPPSPADEGVSLSIYRFVPEAVDTSSWRERFASELVAAIFEEAFSLFYKMARPIESVQECEANHSLRRTHHRNMAGRWSGPRLCWTPELLPFSPCRNRPGSRSSLSSSRLSSSHNSLAANKADDSSFITSAMSHDVLTGSEISDMYNVPFDSDIYAVPIDVVRPLHESRVPQKPKRQQRHHRKRKKQITSSSQSELDHQVQQIHKLKNTNFATNAVSSQIHVIKSLRSVSPDTSSEPGKRHSVPGSSVTQQLRSDRTEPIHMTLQEVRQYLQNLYSSSSDSSENKIKADITSTNQGDKTTNNNNKCDVTCNDLVSLKSVNCNFVSSTNNNARKHEKKTFVINIKNKNAKESSELSCKENTNMDYTCDKEKLKKNPGRNSFSTNLKQTLCNIFRIRKPISPEHGGHGRRAVVVEVIDDSDTGDGALLADEPKAPFLKRALPPLPPVSNGVAPDAISVPDDGQIEEELEDPGEEPSMDFASSIEKVKDYGWYWGPISGEAAERILSNEPDGSFIVRDSSDNHYIFSLTFKLNGCIRHVRIEHDQGNFSFGSCTKFKSHTIVEFIENAVEHSRSGRYLFFLHRRPVLGPMRVQLLHPVSRYKQVQSLQHMCRFVILKLVRRDLISTLPLPRRVIDYLSTPHYYSEQMVEDESQGPSPMSEDGVDLISFVPQGLS